MKRPVYEETRRNRKNKSHNVEKLTPQGEQLACWRPDRWASSHPASRPQAPRGQALAFAQRLPLGGRRDWRSGGQSLLSRRPRRDRESVAPTPGAQHGYPPWAQAEGTG